MLPILFIDIFSSNHYETTPDLKNLSIYGDSIITQEDVKQGRVISAIEYVFIDGTIPTIGPSAFKEFTGLISIHIPPSVRKISENAFQKCIAMTSCTFSEGLETIAGSVFFGATSLTSLSFPASVSSIDFDYLTYGCSKLSYISFEDGNLNYTTDENHYFVLSKDKTKVLSCATLPSIVTLPSYVEILGSFFANSRLDQLNFYSDSKLRIVESYAFRQSKIKSIIFPSGLETIQSTAFLQARVENITLSESIVSLDTMAFSQANSLMNVFIPSGNQNFKSFDGVIYNFNQTKLMFIPAQKESITLASTLEELSDSTIQQSNLVSVEISNNTKYSSFKGILYTDSNRTLFACPGKLIHAEVHPDCTELRDYCFQSCSIKTIDIEKCSIEKIGYMAFKGCKDLLSIQFSSTLTSIGMYCFSSCSSLSGDLNFPSTLENIKSNIFTSTNITSADFSACSKLTVLPGNFFRDCSIERIIFPPNLEEIQSSCFLSCTSLKSLELVDSLVIIKESAFEGCTKLSTISKWGKNLKEIENEAFASTGLVDVEYPSGVEIVTTKVFADCKQLKTITFKEESNMTTIQVQAFANTPNLHTIILPPKFSHVDTGAFFDTFGLKNIKVSENNTKFIGIDGMLISKNRTVLYACAGGVASIEIPDTVNTIMPSTFYGCINLKNATFEDGEKGKGIKEIPDSVFYSCVSLEFIQIPKGVISIRKNSFFNCTALSSVAVSNSSELELIESNSFRGCESLKSFKFEGSCCLRQIQSDCFSGCSNLTGFRFPSSVEVIGDHCFLGCSAIERLRLPSVLNTLGSESFGDCEGIRWITFCGTAPIGSTAAFSDSTKGRVVSVTVPMEFSGDEFCGIRVEKILDADCMISSSRFSLGSETQPNNMLNVIGLLTCSDDE